MWPFSNAPSKQQPYTGRSKKPSFSIKQGILTAGAIAAALLAILAFTGKRTDCYYAIFPQCPIQFANEEHYNVLLLPFGASYRCLEGANCERAIQTRFNNMLDAQPELGIEIAIDSTFDPAYDITRKQARQSGQRCGADMVIWGTDNSQCDWDSSLIKLEYVLVLDKEQEAAPFVEAEGDFGYQSIDNISKLEEGELIGDVEDIIWWILGSKHVEDKNYEQALFYFEKINITARPEYAGIYFTIGWVQDQLVRYDSAVSYYERSVELFEQQPQINSANRATALNNLGSAWHRKGAYDQAIGYFEKALAIDRAALGDNHPNVARDYNNLGSAWHRKGAYDQAIGYYEKAVAIAQATLGPNHPNTKTFENNLRQARQAARSE